nr:Acetyltransferase (GNAT) family [uncultured bacterium]
MSAHFTNKGYRVSYLADCAAHIPALAKMWFQELGQQWIPNASCAKAEKNLAAHLNQNTLPLTFVVFNENSPIAMASLRKEDGLQSDLTPWLGSLIVSPNFRLQKIGEGLVNLIEHEALKLGHQKLYLFTLDLTIHQWYERLGFACIGTDKLYHHPIRVMEKLI